MGAAFNWYFWDPIFWECALNFLAGRAGIIVGNDVDRDHTRIFLKFAQRDSRRIIFSQINSAVRAGFSRIG
jgi:hypothetical protein